MSQPLSDFHSRSAAKAPESVAGDAVREPGNPDDSPATDELTPPAPLFSPLESQIAALLQQGKRGAGWFYSIAGFSIINSLLMLFGGGTFFVIGLGATLIVDWNAVQQAQAAPEQALVVKAVAFAIDLVVAAIVCGFGWLSVKRWQPVFILGMILYLLDGLLFLMAGQMLAVAFHAYGLYCMGSGLLAYRRLAVLERQLMDPLHPAGIVNPQ